MSQTTRISSLKTLVHQFCRVFPSELKQYVFLMTSGLQNRKCCCPDKQSKLCVRAYLKSFLVDNWWTLVFNRTTQFLLNLLSLIPAVGALTALWLLLSNRPDTHCILIHQEQTGRMMCVCARVAPLVWPREGSGSWLCERISRNQSITSITQLVSQCFPACLVDTKWDTLKGWFSSLGFKDRRLWATWHMMAEEHEAGWKKWIDIWMHIRYKAVQRKSELGTVQRCVYWKGSSGTCIIGKLPLFFLQPGLCF